MGVGAYTAAVLGGEAQGKVIGLGLDMVIWLPLAGLVPALVAFVLAPLAARVHGLYLAILTLGLVFIGEHIFKEAKPITGGAGVGRAPAEPVFLGFDLFSNHTILGYRIDRFTVFYVACLVIFLVIFVFHIIVFFSSLLLFLILKYFLDLDIEVNLVSLVELAPLLVQLLLGRHHHRHHVAFSFGDHRALLVCYGSTFCCCF